MLFYIVETVIFTIGFIWLVQMIWLVVALAMENWREDKPRPTIISMSDFYVARGHRVSDMGNRTVRFPPNTDSPAEAWYPAEQHCDAG